MKHQISYQISAAFAAFLMCGTLLTLQAKTIVVNNQAANASDANAGTEALPLKTIQAGANLAQSGDTVSVKTGVYREWVKPPRGGVSEQQRIVYRAAPGQTVSVRGSEQIKTWIDQGGNVWMVDLDNSFFGTFNPFATLLTGGWLNFGKTCHRGEVFLNLDALYEKTALADVQSTVKSWFTQAVNGKTRIYANFGGVNPNTGLVEINVRECVFFPALEGLGYVTVEGFDVRHAATSWCYHGSRENGAVGPNFGLRWIIQNCTISDSKCVGISLGSSSLAPNWPIFGSGGLNFPNGSGFGHHIIRNNHITRSGHAGIFGQLGSFASIIEDNFIEQTGYKKEFGGWEKAGIKLHYSMDCIIRNNRISVMNMGKTNDDCPTIFLDWGAQNTRISGNVMYSVGGAASGLKLEVNHGPILVDNNVFANIGHTQWSEAGVFVHNIFYSCIFSFVDGTTTIPRSSNIFLPHSTADANPPRAIGGLRNDRILNNIFIGRGLGSCSTAVNYIINNNLYLDGAAKKSGYDAASITDGTASNCSFVETANEINLTVNFSAASVGMNCPLVTTASLGKFAVPNMFVEEQDGTPITIATDYFYKSFDRTHILPGPIQSFKLGSNSLKLWPKPNNTPVSLVTPGKKMVPMYKASVQTGGAIYDIRGRLVARSSGLSSKTKRPVPAGIYFIKSGASMVLTGTPLL